MLTAFRDNGVDAAWRTAFKVAPLTANPHMRYLPPNTPVVEALTAELRDEAASCREAEAAHETLFRAVSKALISAPELTANGAA